MLVPAGQRLMQAFTAAVQVTRDQFMHAHRLAVASPKMSHAKASGTPTVNQRSYEDIIRSSTMSPERRAYWLGED